MDKNEMDKLKNEGWSDMKKSLDLEMPIDRNRRPYLLLLLLVSLVAIGVYFVFFYDKTTNSDPTLNDFASSETISTKNTSIGISSENETTTLKGKNSTSASSSIHDEGREEYNQKKIIQSGQSTVKQSVTTSTSSKSDKINASDRKDPTSTDEKLLLSGSETDDEKQEINRTNEESIRSVIKNDMEDYSGSIKNRRNGIHKSFVLLENSVESYILTQDLSSLPLKETEYQDQQLSDYFGRTGISHQSQLRQLRIFLHLGMNVSINKKFSIRPFIGAVHSYINQENFIRKVRENSTGLNQYVDNNNGSLDNSEFGMETGIALNYAFLPHWSSSLTYQYSHYFADATNVSNEYIDGNAFPSLDLERSLINEYESVVNNFHDVGIGVQYSMTKNWDIGTTLFYTVNLNADYYNPFTAELSMRYSF